MNMNVLIPAVPRSELHESTINKLIRGLVDSGINTQVFINFDIPPLLGDKNYEKTLHTLRNIAGENNVFFHVNDVDPCFTKAFLKVFEMCDKNGQDGYYFWLEDDWELVNKDLFLDNLKLLKTYDTLCLVNGGPGGPPFIFNKIFFEMIRKVVGQFKFNGFKLKEYDPEPIMIMAYDTFVRDIKNIRVGGRTDESRGDPIILIDRGRDWRDKRKIKKWSRKISGGSKTWSM